MSNFRDSRFSNLKEYVPGEQPQDKSYIKLNTNESPYPPSKSVIDVLNREEAEKLRLYCDPDCNLLREKLAEIYGVGKENIFVSNGSDDILNFAFMLYGRQNGAAFPDITYGFYNVFCKLYGIDYSEIPLSHDFSINPEDYMANGKFNVIANPNAPTGMALSEEDIERIIASNPNNVVVIDEAYIDFGGKSCYKLINKYNNLIVCRTFSKSRSMAGARLGYCFACRDLIGDLELIKNSTNPYNVNRLTQAAGVAALNENEYYKANCKKIAETREFTVSELEKLGFTVLPSIANFVFAKHNSVGGQELYLKLKENGFLVRHFTNPRICEFNRITIGSKREMESLINQLKVIVGGKV